MQNIETFKCATIAMPRTPSTTLVLPTPEVSDQPMPTERATMSHRARYDAALTTTSPRGLRVILFLSVALILLGWFFSLWLVWRMQ